MGRDEFNPGESVTLMAGAFIGTAGVVTSSDEVAGRWPDASTAPLGSQDGLWVVIRIFDREVPVFIQGEFLEPRSIVV